MSSYKDSAWSNKLIDRGDTQVITWNNGQERLASGGARVALLTAGRDKPYALGMAAALTGAGLEIDFIGSDEMMVSEVVSNPMIRALNLRGDQRVDARPAEKFVRIANYYLRLIAYAVSSKAQIFHILWNNKFELLDRTMLMLWYRLWRRKLVFTAHNVNSGNRDGNDSWFNRFTLKIQYWLSDEIFVHTEKMRRELVSDFGVAAAKVSVIPFGINNTVPCTSLAEDAARLRLGLAATDKVILFFGNIAPYKGVEFLVSAFAEVLREDPSYRLIVAGRPKGSEQYWASVHAEIRRLGIQGQVVERIEYVPDEETEVFFKAADVLMLPYAHVFQSGVLFLGYSFGLPVIASDVGSLKEDIMVGRTGYVVPPRDVAALAGAIRTYFASALFSDLPARRFDIRAHANERYSWTRVAEITSSVYAKHIGQLVG